jgi:hypothetical protein
MSPGVLKDDVCTSFGYNIPDCYCSRKKINISGDCNSCFVFYNIRAAINIPPKNKDSMSSNDNLRVKAHKAVDDARVAVNEVVDDAKTAVHNATTSKTTVQNVVDDVKIEAHKIGADAKIKMHQVEAELKKK